MNISPTPPLLPPVLMWLRAVELVSISEPGPNVMPVPPNPLPPVTVTLPTVTDPLVKGLRTDALGGFAGS